MENYDKAPNTKTIEQLIAEAVAKSEAKLKAQFLKGKTNAIQLGVTIKDLDIKEGKEIIKDGVQQINQHGEIARYPDKYIVTVSFNGGLLTQEVKESTYSKLELGKSYFATGYLGEVKVFGKAEILPILSDFEKLDF